MNLQAPIPLPVAPALGDLLYAVDLPPPLSVNGLFHNSPKFPTSGRKMKGRGKTKKYRDWIQAAGQMLVAQGRRPVLSGQFAVIFTLGDDSRDSLPDTDNVGKAYLDLFVKHRILPDDSPRIIRHLAYTWAPGTRCCVHIYRWEAQP